MPSIYDENRNDGHSDAACWTTTINRLKTHPFCFVVSQFILAQHEPARFPCLQEKVEMDLKCHPNYWVITIQIE